MPRISLLLLLGCSESGFTQLEQEDLFQQERIHTVDVLLVVDNSCSMVEEQAMLGDQFDSFLTYFDDVDVDWQLGVITTDTVDERFSGKLIGGDDEIVLIDADGRSKDEVAYDIEWPIAPGAVFALDRTWTAQNKNDNLDNWCVSDTGTPGAENPDCGGTGPGPTAGTNGTSPLVITEFLADPDGIADEEGEWVEITNVGDTDIDLSGYALADNGRNAFTVPGGVTIAAGQALVFSRTANEGGIPVGAAFTLNNHELYITKDTEGPAEIFAEMVAQGISGSGAEMGLEAARMALTEPLVGAENAGFLREEANLSILIVSDEEDSSPDRVDDYLNDLVMVKGEEAYRDHQIMNISGVVGDTPPEFSGEPACSSANGNASYGSRYVYAANRTEGLLDSICEADWAPIVERLGLLASGLQASFALSEVPILDTLEVGLYSDTTEESKIRDLTIDVDYLYDEIENELVFEGDQIPPSETYILAAYRIRSGS